jgi:hypothetical protein
MFGSLSALNTIYTPLSSSIANLLANSPIAQSFMKMLLYPLIGVFYISESFIHFNSTIGIILTGLISSSLFGTIYFVPLVLPFIRFQKFQETSKKIFRVVRLLWPINIAFVVIGEIAGLSLFLILGVLPLFLSTLILSTFIVASGIAKRLSIIAFRQNLSSHPKAKINK